MDTFHRSPDFSIAYSAQNMAHIRKLEHYHDACELAFFVHADMQIFVKDSRYEIRDGDLLFIRSYDVHRMVYGPRDYVRYVVNFKPSFVEPVLAASGQPSVMAQLSALATPHLPGELRRSAQVEQAFQKLLATYRQSLDDQSASRSSLRLQLAELLLQLRAWMNHSPPNSPAGNRAERQVKHIIAYLDERFAEPLNLNDISKAIRLSKYHLCRLFKEVTHFTVTEYIQHRRIIEAQKRLKAETRPILDIGMDCGFPSVQHFHRVFKKTTGLTPAEFRRSHRQRADNP